MSRALSRKARGAKTVALLAERWQQWIYPYATDVGAGRPGNDLLHTGSLAVEVKARDTVSIEAALRQATHNHPDSTPILVWRHNGQGEKTMDEWTVSMRLKDFEGLWERAQKIP